MRFFAPVLVILAIVLVLPANAMDLPGLAITLTCDGFSYGDFTIIADRDNTGTNAEAYQISVVDGSSTLLHFVENTSGLPLDSYFEGAGSSPYGLSATPLDSVRIYTWLSLAGNGFEDEVVYTTTNPDCGAEPPTATPTPENTPEPGSIVVTVILVWPSHTPTPEPTEGPSPTPTETPTATPDFVMEGTVEVDGVGQDVAIVYQIDAGQIGQLIFLAFITGLVAIGLLFGAKR